MWERASTVLAGSLCRLVDIAVDGDFGVDRVRVTQIAADSVTFEADAPGIHLGSTIGAGGSSQLNEIRISVPAIRNGTAVVQFSPA